MRARIWPGLAALCSLGLVLLCRCSSEEPASACPPCPSGQSCSAATGYRCAPAGAAGCATAGCGANATCRADGVCTCAAGFVDCDLDLDRPPGSGNGCECQGGCSGAVCAPTGGCSPTTAHTCGSYTQHCSGGVCVACPGASFNCDGLADCESTSRCDSTAACSPTQPLACGTERYCAGEACADCPAGKHNCDGVQGCESDASCEGPGPTPTACDASCTEYVPMYCVKNPASNNRCEECTSDVDCQANPRAHGPRCDTSDLAGTGYNWCTCKDDSDCATNTIGKRCQMTPTAKPTQAFSQCTCQTDADCNAPYTICEGGSAGYGRCRKPCREAGPTTPLDQTCKWFGKTGICNEADGRCTYGQF